MDRVLACLAILALSGCGGADAPGGGETAPASPGGDAAAAAPRRSDVTVTEITLGRALQPDRRVARPLDNFAPGDTIYASVVTEGVAREGLLKARWTYQNSEVVAESSLYIANQGTTVSEFHISKPDGLPRGAYEVEIFLDGTAAGKRSFSVR